MSGTEGGFGIALDVTVDVRLASAGSRALAQFVDLLVVQTIQVLLLVGCAGAALLLGLAVEDLQSASWLVALVLVAIFSVQWGYFTVFEWAWRGQTPGKRLLRLRVVTEDGGEAGPVAIAIRNLLRPIDFFPAGYFLGFVCVALHPQSKRIGDLAAGTVVVVEESGAAVARRWPPGLRLEEARLVEAWFERAPVLSPERREALAGRLVDRIRAGHPDLRIPEGPAVGALHTLFPVDA